MKIKILLKALRFSLLPTLVTILLILVGFFSFTETLNFVTSNSGWAIFTRIALFIAEVLLVIIMYRVYENDELFNSENPEEYGIPFREVKGNESMRDFTNATYDSRFNIYKTKKSYIYIIEKITKI